MIGLIDLPIPEEIYDLDTFALREINEKISQCKVKLENQFKNESIDNIKVQQWMKKAKKIMELSNLEIQERNAIENFGQNCVQDENQFFARLEANYVEQQKNINSWQNLQKIIENHSQLQPIEISQPQTTTALNDANATIKQKITSPKPKQASQMPNERYIEAYSVPQLCINTASTPSKKLINSQTSHYQFQTTNNIDQSEIVSEYSEQRSICSDLSLIGNFQRKIGKKKKNHNIQMDDFIKKTLESTKITDNRIIIGKGSAGKYIPTILNPQQQLKNSSVTLKNNKMSSGEYQQQDYKNVRSKVKENIENMKIKKLQSQEGSYITAKSNHPKYKPKETENNNEKRSAKQKIVVNEEDYEDQNTEQIIPNKIIYHTSKNKNVAAQIENKQRSKSQKKRTTSEIIQPKSQQSKEEITQENERVIQQESILKKEESIDKDNEQNLMNIPQESMQNKEEQSIKEQLQEVEDTKENINNTNETKSGQITSSLNALNLNNQKSQNQQPLEIDTNQGEGNLLQTDLQNQSKINNNISNIQDNFEKQQIEVIEEVAENIYDSQENVSQDKPKFISSTAPIADEYNDQGHTQELIKNYNQTLQDIIQEEIEESEEPEQSKTSISKQRALKKKIIYNKQQNYQNKVKQNQTQQEDVNKSQITIENDQKLSQLQHDNYPLIANDQQDCNLNREITLQQNSCYQDQEITIKDLQQQNQIDKIEVELPNEQKQIEQSDNGNAINKQQMLNQLMAQEYDQNQDISYKEDQNNQEIIKFQQKQQEIQDQEANIIKEIEEIQKLVLKKKVHQQQQQQKLKKKIDIVNDQQDRKDVMQIQCPQFTFLKSEDMDLLESPTDQQFLGKMDNLVQNIVDETKRDELAFKIKQIARMKKEMRQQQKNIQNYAQNTIITDIELVTPDQFQEQLQKQKEHEQETIKLLEVKSPNSQQSHKGKEKRNSKSPEQQKDQEQVNSQQKADLYLKSIQKKKKPPHSPKPLSIPQKLIAKMMLVIKDDQLVDYSHIYPNFESIFSAFYLLDIIHSSTSSQGKQINFTQNYLGNINTNNNSTNNNGGSSNNENKCGYLDLMIEINSIFSQHQDKVDKVDKLLNKANPLLFTTPLEATGSEYYYAKDPNSVLVYANRVNIDMKKFIERQIIQMQRSQISPNEGSGGEGGKLQLNQQMQSKDVQYFRVVKGRQDVQDIITRSFSRKWHWEELPRGLSLRTSWNLLWTWSKPQIEMNKLLSWQKVNHFPFNKNIVRKDLLKANIQRIAKLHPKVANSFDIIPITFVLPKEYINFSIQFHQDEVTEGEQNIWIMKPVGKSQGRGISLVNNITQVVYSETVILQKYLKNPLLLDGHKFDMRIYVLVTSMNPLEAFVYKEGFARLSTEIFTLDPQRISNRLIHLTNFAIQKKHYDPNTMDNFIGGTKITLTMLQQKFEDNGFSWERIWTQVKEIIIKSLLAGQLEIPFCINSFEVFGYDIIIDSNMKCWLLEINSSPSLARDFIIDDLVKQQMVDDSIDLVAPINFDRERLVEVLDRRIREEQGNKSAVNTLNNSKLQLNRDINYILHGQKIRTYGEIPTNIGGFELVAPTPLSDKYIKLIQAYKLPPVKSNQGFNNLKQQNSSID